MIHEDSQTLVISDEKPTLMSLKVTSAVLLPMLPEGLSFDFIILSSPEP